VLRDYSEERRCGPGVAEERWHGLSVAEERRRRGAAQVHTPTSLSSSQVCGAWRPHPPSSVQAKAKDDNASDLTHGAPHRQLFPNLAAAAILGGDGGLGSDLGLDLGSDIFYYWKLIFDAG
jgi:hypothetical protein